MNVLKRILSSKEYALLNELGLGSPQAVKAAQAFQDAFNSIGGTMRLAMWADKNPDKFYALYSKLIPSTTVVDEKKDIRITIEWAGPNRLSYRNAQVPASGTVPALPQPEATMGVPLHSSPGGKDSSPGE